MFAGDIGRHGRKADHRRWTTKDDRPIARALRGSTQCFIASQTPVTFVRIVFKFLDRQRLDRLQHALGSCIGHQDVETAKAVERGRDRCRHTYLVSRVGNTVAHIAMGLEPALVAASLSAERPTSMTFAPRSRKSRWLLADPTGGSGDDGHLVVEPLPWTTLLGCLRRDELNCVTMSNSDGGRLSTGRIAEIRDSLALGGLGWKSKTGAQCQQWVESGPWLGAYRQKLIRIGLDQVEEVIAAYKE